MGRSDHYVHGDWACLCDRCGFRYHASDLKEEWTGFMVCNMCYEPRHDSDFVRGVPDDPSVPWTRSAPEVEDTEKNGDITKTLIQGSNENIQCWNEELTKDRVVIVSATNASVGDRFTIYKTEDDGNTLYITTKTLDSGTSV